MEDKTLKLAKLLVALCLVCVTARAEEFNFTLWNDLLAEYVAQGQVNYPGLQSDPRFDALLDNLAAVDTEALAKSNELALYINAYNIFAIKGIIDGRSPSSSIGKLRYFMLDKYELGGQSISLDKLEHKIIRPLGEPRIHFAIVCASASCPLLISEAYIPENLEDQLNNSARLFINDTTKNQFDTANKTAGISKIFKWFKEDFGTSDENVLAYIQPFLNEDIEELTAYKIKYQAYDWSLNGAPPD